MKYKKIINKLIDILFFFCVIIIVIILLQFFCISSFNIPSDSMEPALFVGDKIIVNKMVKGARLYNLKKAILKERFKINRIPGYGHFKNNDILVFNFPYPEATWDSISFDIRKYYVKRCIGLPYDTVEIRNGYFKINHTTAHIGDLSSQNIISSLDKYNAGNIQMQTYPWERNLNWTVQEFGPLLVPGKKYLVKLDSVTYRLYHQLIRWEQGKVFKKVGNNFYLNDSIIYSYQFKKNYYFVSGDKLENSQDSRYWGLLPEDYIVGKAVMIWNSKDPHTGKIRWNRIGKKIK